MAEGTNTQATKSAKTKDMKAVVQYRGEPLTITFKDIKELICPLATDQEVAVFLRTCQSLSLNPFASELYLIKYSEKDKAATVIAIDAYLKASEANPNYNGHEAGIILRDSIGKLEFREGAFLFDEEYDKLAGGWARVFRKDREHAFYMAVNKTECIKYTRDGHLTQFWVKEKQPSMLRKTALKRALVEAFPDLFSGVYSTAEFEESPEGQLPVAFSKGGEPEWDKFWTKVAEIGYQDKEEVHKILGVASLKDWINSGRTLEDAIKKLADIKLNLAEFDKLPSASPPEPDIPFIEDKLLQGWGVAKDAVKRLKITGEQIQKWFAHYSIELGLADFEKPMPPAGISNEMLSRFVDSLVAYESSHRAQK